jgi:hypothetical protein
MPHVASGTLPDPDSGVPTKDACQVVNSHNHHSAAAGVKLFPDTLSKCGQGCHTVASHLCKHMHVYRRHMYPGTGSETRIPAAIG